MHIHKLNSRGFAHQVILIAVVNITIIGGVLLTVIKTNNRSTAKSKLTTVSKNASSNNKQSTSDKSQSELPTSNTTTSPTSTSSTPTTTDPKSSTSNSSNSSTAPAPAPAPAPTPAPTPAPVQTPLSALTDLISDLLVNRKQANITANPVTVAGPISDAIARPIVFTANGQTYFAYHQGSAIKFNMSASELANSMAITIATGNPLLELSGIGKVGYLVDSNSMNYLVGYSIGGA